MMATAFIHHRDCELHDPGAQHPESPARIRAINDYLPTSDIWDRLVRHEAPLASREQLCRAHDENYIDVVFSAAPSEGYVYLDPDTCMSPHSLNAALRAAGSVIKGIDLVYTGEADNAFCSVRPCGHHAETRRAMGFCMFNNVAVGACYAKDRYAAKRIAIVDFDVHHGNGTEDIFRHDPSVLFCSTFQHPFYPGSGADTRSDHIVNVPLPAGTSGAQFRDAFEGEIVPALNDFAPELVLVSAGFDAHENDPLAQLRLREDDYEWVTRRIREVADNSAQGRLVSVLEGGYSIASLGSCVEAHLKAML
ncbi:MAG: histone deacetylase family protein [Candidatus Thiodiazotropha sp.]